MILHAELFASDPGVTSYGQSVHALKPKKTKNQEKLSTATTRDRLFFKPVYDMGQIEKMGKAESFEIALYTRPVVPLNKRGITYSLWGKHALHLCFRVPLPPRWGPVHIVVPDDELNRASFAMKTGMPMVHPPEAGSFPECRVFEYQGPDPRPKYAKRDCFFDWSPFVVIIPASVVHFNIRNPRYVKTMEVHPKGYKKSWTVSHPTLPGMLDAACTLIRLYAINENHRRHPEYTSHSLLMNWESLEGHVARQHVLRLHGTRIWLQLSAYAFTRKSRVGRWATLEDIPEMIKRVAQQLSEENIDYYLKELCIDHISNELPSDEICADYETEEDTDYEDDETWEQVYGVAEKVKSSHMAR
ncbi:hypothetical protein BJ508DRAFT_303618 [Ascobolus immersus RN42]|uniref:Uncharacterized protein n=1 Tax=Ascobolus immersus RN42 TaxID=1160509 RepID=A0A3N4IIG7_ASCIM|nr:hypothetical protein BJ508DRAFT_303618 [Ascobolus immersus RN42]